MRAPLILRLGLAWAALRGTYVSISYGNSPGTWGAWRFEIADAPKGWLKRRDRINAKKAAVRGPEAPKGWTDEAKEEI